MKIQLYFILKDDRNTLMLRKLLIIIINRMSRVDTAPILKHFHELAIDIKSAWLVQCVPFIQSNFHPSGQNMLYDLISYSYN